MTNQQAFLTFLQEQNFHKQNLQLLQWDSHTNIPTKGYEQRAEVIGYFSEKLHELQTSDQMKNYIDLFINDEDDKIRALAHECNVIYNRVKKIPAHLQKSYAMQISKSEAIWSQAKDESNFELFKPALQKMIQLTQEIADCLGDPNNRYDALLQQWEPGMTTAQLDQLFPPLRNSLVGLLTSIQQSDRVIDESILTQSFPIDQQEQLCFQLLTTIGFDHEAGHLGTSAHPFTFGIHSNDVRITTRFDEFDLRQSIFGALHEGGHALYEQGFSKGIINTPLAEASSMGMHESQALLWENLIGHSRAFWQTHLQTLKDYAPASFKHLTTEQFYTALHRVKPSLIRVDADEVTYSLHIMMRYEIEKLLINGDLSVDELPRVWNEKMKTYLGIEPESDRDGVLQDIHWASGYFGYFPTYTLGSMYAAQLLHHIEGELNIDEAIENNQLTNVKDWLTKHLYKTGKQKEPLQLIQELTSESLCPNYLINYLTNKYKDIYQF